jgi:acetylglutamate kinase
LVGLGGFAPKTNQKPLGAAKPPRTPPPEADVATAVLSGIERTSMRFCNGHHAEYAIRIEITHHNSTYKEQSVDAVTVVKVGGNELDDPAFLDGLCAAIAAWQGPLVLVHGGGKEITAAMDLHGLPVEFVGGLRITSSEALEVMQAVVRGTVNARVVRRLVGAGVPAIGLTGLDLGVLRCEPHRPDGLDLGRVGIVTDVNTPVLRALLAQGWLPTFAPLALGREDNLAYNVNADMIAQAIAAALGAAELVFVSNVPGVILDGAVVAQLSAAEVDAAIASGAISGGMIPKVRAALGALAAGAQSVRICNLAGFAGGGTRFA